MSAAATAPRASRVVAWADLALLLARTDDPEVAVRAAKLVGFVPVEHKASVDDAPSGAPREHPLGFAAAPAVAPDAEANPPVPLLHLTTLERLPEATRAPTPEPEAVEAAPAGDGARPAQRTLVDLAPGPPLTPWSRLWPVLRQKLGAEAPGRSLDVRALVRGLARGEQLPRPLPRRKSRGWGGPVEVWLDLAERTALFRGDGAAVTARLARAVGRHGLCVRPLEEPDQRICVDDEGQVVPRHLLPPPGTTVLALSDLGQYGDAAVRAAWCRTGRELVRRGVRLAALVPVPHPRWDQAVARVWRPEPWEQRGLERRGEAHPTKDPAERAERLLSLCSPSAWTSPGLLRELRHLLGAHEADVGTEADCWNHEDARLGCSVALVLSPGARERLRRRFAAQESTQMKEDVSRLLGRRHRLLVRELLDAETLIWEYGGLGEPPAAERPQDAPEPVEPAAARPPAARAPVAPPGDPLQARATLRRLASGARSGGWAEDRLAQVARYAAELMPQLPADVVRDATIGPDAAVLTALGAWASRQRFAGSPEVAAALGQLDVLGRPLRWWSLRQEGARLVARAGAGPWPAAATHGSSPVGGVQARWPQLVVTPEGAAPSIVNLDAPDRSIRLPAAGRVEVVSDHHRAVLEPIACPDWAVAAGRDRYGLWADAEIWGVVQRFRWVPPGTFLMGSPETEAGRWDDEGPQHEVTLTRGYWMGDTPVTQALWEAVLGKNPSQFRTPDRPVEQVSWTDCDELLRELAALAPGLAARLPTEAEWENACRAGTATATWLGDLEIRGENDAPLLDPISWYGGNCGQDFELANGFDMSRWPGRQYQETRGGTHPVARKAPNPLGLYDMLGNVWEWCSDRLGSYTAWPVADPGGPDAGSRRVIRGGSWFRPARSVRAAYRNGHPPEGRSENLGFRLARGHGPGGQGEGAHTTPPAEGQRSGPETGGGVRAPVGGATATARSKLPRDHRSAPPPPIPPTPTSPRRRPR